MDFPCKRADTIDIVLKSAMYALYASWGCGCTVPQLSGTIYGSIKGANERLRVANATVTKDGVFAAKGERKMAVKDINNGIR